MSQGLPEAAIADLAVHRRTRLLRAATHGQRSLGDYVGQRNRAQTRASTCALTTLTRGASSAVPGFRGWKGLRTRPREVFQGLSLDEPLTSKCAAHPWGAQPSARRPRSSTSLPISAITSIPRTRRPPTTPAPTASLHPGAQPGSNRAARELTCASCSCSLTRRLACRPCPWTTPPASPPATRRNWLAGTPWRFADPLTPYRTLTGAVEARTCAGRNLRRSTSRRWHSQLGITTSAPPRSSQRSRRRTGSSPQGTHRSTRSP